MSNDALQELEVKVAFLEDALTKLSDEHYEQQKELEKLRTGYALLSEKIKNNGGDDSAQSMIEDEKPPHY